MSFYGQVRKKIGSQNFKQSICLLSDKSKIQVGEEVPDRNYNNCEEL